MLTVSSARWTLIQQVNEALVWTHRCKRISVKQRLSDYIRIRRGVYLKKKILTSVPARWEKQERVFIAQCIVACELAPTSTALTHESALYFLDIPTVEAPPVISMSYGERRWRLRSPFPPVYCGGQLISKQRPVRFYHDGSSTSYTIGSARVSSPQTIMMDLSLQGRQRPAFAAANLLMRSMLSDTRYSAELLQTSALLKKQFTHMFKKKRCRTSKAKGAAFINALDPNIESIAEGCLLWDLYAAQAKAWKTQYTVSRYRADFCIPSERVLLEVEGAAKLGSTAEDKHRNAAALINRSSVLTQRGYQVFAIPAAEILFSPQRVIAGLRTNAPQIFSGEYAPPWWCDEGKVKKKASARRSTGLIKRAAATV